MSLPTRLDKAKNAVARLLQQQDAGTGKTDNRNWTPQDWLAHYEQLGAAGYFAHEPDFPTALAEYRQAIADGLAEARDDDDPATWYQCDVRAGQYRRQPWQSPIALAQIWLAEMSTRRRQRIPPCSEAEFQALAGWYADNGERIQERFGYSLDLGDGFEWSAGTTLWDLESGPRHYGSGRVAETVRRLQRRFLVGLEQPTPAGEEAMNQVIEFALEKMSEADVTAFLDDLRQVPELRDFVADVEADRQLA